MRIVSVSRREAYKKKIDLLSRQRADGRVCVTPFRRNQLEVRVHTFRDMCIDKALHLNEWSHTLHLFRIYLHMRNIHNYRMKWKRCVLTHWDSGKRAKRKHYIHTILFISFWSWLRVRKHNQTWMAFEKCVCVRARWKERERHTQTRNEKKRETLVEWKAEKW